MVVAPHGAFAVADFLAGGDVVPTVGAMVDGVQDEALVFGVGGEVGFVEEGFGNGEAGLAVAEAVGGVAFGGQIVAKADQALGGYGGSGGVDRFPVVAGVGGFLEVVAEAVEVRGAGVPHGDAVGAGVGEVEVGGSGGGVEAKKSEIRKSLRTGTFVS